MGFQECCCCHHHDPYENREIRLPPAELKIVGHCIHGNNFVTCIKCRRKREFDLNHPYSCTCKLCVGERPLAVSGSMSFTPKIDATPYKDINAFLEDCLETMRVKGHDYREGNDEDLIHNFRTVAEDMGLEMEQVWYIYASKHWKAIKTFIKSGGQSESEPIEGRIKDIIVYSLLLYRMVNKGKGPEPKKEPVYFTISAGFSAEEKLPLMAEPLKDFTGKHAQALVDEHPFVGIPYQNVERPAGSLDPREAPIKIKSNPPTNPLEIDPQRMFKLIGEPGVFVPPAVVNRAAEIAKELEGREPKGYQPAAGAEFFIEPLEPLTAEQREEIGLVLSESEKGSNA